MNNLIIGIAGGSGSGKTTLALRLKERFGEDEVRLISHDSYYKRHDELPFEERCKLNYDHPDAFDNALLIYHLQELKAGRAIDCPVYDYSNHNRSDKVQHIEPAPVLIVEGILPFVEPELCALFDYKIYVDTDADERILRRLVRDVKERGRSLDSVIDQYLTTVKPMHEAFVEPSKRNADIIVPNGGENTAAVEMLAHHIRNLIEKANRLWDDWECAPRSLCAYSAEELFKFWGFRKVCGLSRTPFFTRGVVEENGMGRVCFLREAAARI